jgi:hypothetical protein
MIVDCINISRIDVLQLVERLESEPFPARCNIVLIEGRDSGGLVETRQIRLEIAPDRPGVLLPLDTHSEYIDWAVRELVGLGFAQRN